jgi:Protein of unknown function (DUF1091)
MFLSTLPDRFTTPRFRQIILITRFLKFLLSFFYQARFDLQMKTLTPYYNSVINTTLNLCEFVNGTDNNVATKYFIDLYSKSLPPGFVHPCPYFGEVKLNNISVNAAPQSIQFLTGIYKCKTRFFDDKDDNIITALHEIELKDVKERN